MYLQAISAKCIGKLKYQIKCIVKEIAAKCKWILGLQNNCPTSIHTSYCAKKIDFYKKIPLLDRHLSTVMGSCTERTFPDELMLRSLLMTSY
jgi:hypothetical protein